MVARADNALKEVRGLIAAEAEKNAPPADPAAPPVVAAVDDEDENYQPDPELKLRNVVEDTRAAEQEHVLKNAFGFGGCNACLVFRRVH